jgi:hypothetical protein
MPPGPTWRSETKSKPSPSVKVRMGAAIAIVAKKRAASMRGATFIVTLVVCLWILRKFCTVGLLESLCVLAETRDGCVS